MRRPPIPTAAAVALLLLLSACTGAPAGQAAASSPVPATAPSPTTLPEPPVTEAPATTAAPPRPAPTTTAAPPPEVAQDPALANLRETLEYAERLEVDVHAPAEVGPWPVVVTVHGGGWFGGSRGSMAPLADALASEGAVVFNASYRTIARGGGFPASVDDVACAVAVAREEASRYTTTSDRVAVVGHSAGAHLAALAAMAPGEFGAGCGADTSRGVDALVGLAGPYDTDRLSFLLGPFFGASLEEDPETWTRGNPLSRVLESPSIPVLLVHGDADEVVPLAFSEELADALFRAGREVDFDVLRDVSHNGLLNPAVVGDLIAGFLTAHLG